MSKETEVCWRVFLNGKFSHTAYGATGHDVIAKENERLGNMKAATTHIQAFRANSASD